jgi:hypothetical protein
MPPRALLVLALLCGAPTAASCADGDPACYPTDWRACNCDDGAVGYQQCGTDGSAYGACDCSGTIPGLTTASCSGGEAGAGGGGKVAYLCACSTNEECETGLCHPFNMKGPLCSKPCAADTDCPTPSPGCNNMGICKAP